MDGDGLPEGTIGEVIEFGSASRHFEDFLESAARTGFSLWNLSACQTFSFKRKPSKRASLKVSIGNGAKRCRPRNGLRCLASRPL